MQEVRRNSHYLIFFSDSCTYQFLLECQSILSVVVNDIKKKKSIYIKIILNQFLGFEDIFKLSFLKCLSRIFRIFFLFIANILRLKLMLLNKKNMIFRFFAKIDHILNIFYFSFFFLSLYGVKLWFFALSKWSCSVVVAMETNSLTYIEIVLNWFRTSSSIIHIIFFKNPIIFVTGSNLLNML